MPRKGNGSLIAPIAVILAANLMIFVLVIRRLAKHQSAKRTTKTSRSPSADTESLARNAKLSIALASLLGLTWIFGLLIHSLISQKCFSTYSPFSPPYTEGFAIFVFHCPVLHPQVRMLWMTLPARGPAKSKPTWTPPVHGIINIRSIDVGIKDEDEQPKKQSCREGEFLPV